MRRYAVRVRIVPALAVAAVLTAGVAVAGWFGHHRADDRSAAVRQSLAAAPAAAKAIFSYDYRTFDASVANGKLFVTGTFADEYAETTAALKKTATSEQAVVLAEVSSTGVVNADSDKVELLLYLNQYRRNVNTSGEKVDQNRVVLTMVPVDGEWKVSQAAAI
jgi:Mce-associated membrane protein